MLRPMPLARLLSCAAAVLALATAARPARAQQAPTPEEVHQAQERWAEGKAAFDAGNYEAARVAFKQAYTIFQHPAFLQNLGEAELRTGRMVEAARHLTLFLRASSTGSPAQRDFAKKSLKRAAEKLGSIAVETNVDEAEVRVDGELIGLAPLAGLAWHVAPGVHVVSGHKEGYLDGSERMDIPVGAPTRVLVRLQRVMGFTPDAPTDKATGAAPTATVAERAATPLKPAVANSSSSDARTVVLVSGAVATVVAAGLGFGFTLRGRDDEAARSSAQQYLVSLQAVQHLPADPDGACVTQLSGAAQKCAELNENASRLRIDHFMQFVGFIGAGVLGAATVATFFVWQPAGRAALLPVAAPGFAGVQWRAVF